MLDLRDTAAGLTGAVCNVYCGQPFDIAKLRLQTQGSVYRGLWHCLTTMVRTEGVLVLWKGSTASLASTCIENGVVFTMNGVLSRLAGHSADTPLTLTQHACVGALSGVFSGTAITPAELVKCRWQYQHANVAGPYHSPWSIIRQVAAAEGVRGLFRGWSFIMARDIPFNFAFFGSYEAYHYLCTRAWRRFDPAASSRDSPFLNFLCGGLAGSTAWVFIFPMDCIKSRMQAVESAGKARQVIAQARAEGARMFFRGWTAAVFRAFPANAALFVGVEGMKKLLY